MTLDISGALLEGARFSTGNNVYTFPPDSLISNSSSFSTISERAEYAIIAGTLDSSKKQLEIADEDLVFYWCRNEPGITRFDYDSYSGRWLPMPGTYPQVIGDLSNDTRLTIPLPDPDRASSAPYSLYIDDDPRVSFTLNFIGSSDFSDPNLLSELTVEINSSGQLNFSAVDVSERSEKPVSFTGQNFISRTSGNGSVGVLPDFSTSEYRLFLNPKPASGFLPRIRIGYRPYLIPEEVSSESLLVAPPQGYVRWSADTGRLKFSDDDVEANLGETVHYDGLFLGQKQFDRYGVSVSSGWPNVSFNLPAAIGSSDLKRFIVFAEKDGETRRYFNTTSYLSSAPTPGWCYVNLETGNFYLSATDVSNFSSWTFWCIDSLLVVGAPGVGMQMRRSSVNGPGAASVPDFAVVYEVSQVLSNDLQPYPFMMLPTVPLVDDDLTFKVDIGTGKFVGNLVDSSDSTKTGLGYLLNLDLKQLKFTIRTTPRAVLLQKDQSSIKLDGAALNPKGVEVTKDGVLLSASDFDIDVSSGLVEFVEPVGEGEDDAVEVSGAASGSSFTSTASVFTDEFVGRRLLIYSGNNSGIYDIVAVDSGTTITVSPEFDSAEDVTASVRSTDEIIADRFWTPVTSVPKKFSIYRSPDGPGGTFSKISIDGYSVKSNVGQVSISSPALPGESLRIDYVSLDSDDEGVTTTPTQRTEFALFKIGQESASFSVGSKIVTFNADGNTVSTDRPITLYVEGVTQDEDSFAFTPPGTLTLKNAIESGPVTVDYWVKEASGGETTIDLLYSPIDYDNLKVSGPAYGETEGQKELYVSGDQTNSMKPRCALLFENQDVVYIASSSYDSSTDLTKVVFDQAALSDSENIKITGTIKNKKSGSLVFFSSLLNPPYLIPETNSVEIFVNGTNSVRIHGDVSSTYRSGIIIDFDDDPYWTIGSSYDESAGITTVKTAGMARRNYITPTVKRSVRPVLDPSSNFSTSRPAYTSRGFVLANMGTTSSSVLQEGVDYDLGDDGIIAMKSPISYGDVLRAMYVAKVSQPAGTTFEFNFSREIAPDNSNGLVGQKLTIDYNLYAPDSFFYRVETIVTMLPEARDLMTSSASATSYGPNTASTPSQATKDSGLSSPWYDSYHYSNIDVVAQRFLKYYHDLIEMYEDLFSLIDGRNVGGTSGRFRYDGVLGRVVSNYNEIENDIDDSAILYYTIAMSSGFPPSASYVPVYGKMSDANSLSRLFPTTKTTASFIGDTSSATSGQQVGSFDAENITSTGTTVTSRAVSYFVQAISLTGGTQFIVDSSASASELTNVLTGGTALSGTNGDPDSLTPPFVQGQKIQVFDLDGNFLASGEVLALDPTAPHILPTTVPYDSVKSVGVGSIAQTAADFEGDANMQNLYTPGIDYIVSSTTGQIIYFKMPTGFPFQNNPLVGNEVIQATVSFNNPNLAPNRIPALDGSELNDSGRFSIPRTRRNCELRKLFKESLSAKIGFAEYPVFSGLLIDVNSSSPIVIGDVMQFVDGPNSGISVTVTSVTPGGISVNPPLPYVDVTGSNFVIAIDSFNEALSQEIYFLTSELSKLDDVISMFGQTVSSGSGSALSTSQWQDVSADFSGMEGMLLYVHDGPSRGLYKIDTVSGDTATVSPSPYAQLTVGSGSYSVIEPWTFLQEAEFQFVSAFYANTLSFYQSTLSWTGSPSFGDVASRAVIVSQRQAYLADVVGDAGSLTTLLRNGDNLYDTRFLWIDQRTNKETGLTQLQARAFTRGMEILTNVTSDQRKRYLMDSIISQT